jgi:hypothetical protein
MSKQEEKHTKTALEAIFSDHAILTERPAEMEYEDYKYLLKLQNKVIKSHTRHQPSKNVARLLETNNGYNNHAPRRRAQKPTEDPSDNEGSGEQL